MLGSIVAAITLAAVLNTTGNQTNGTETQNEVTANKVIQKEKLFTENAVELMNTNSLESLGEFQTINLNLNVNVMIVVGTETDVIFDGDTEIANLININVEGNVLDISAKSGMLEEFHSKTKDEKFTIIVTVKELTGIVINGNGNVHCHDAVNTDNLNIEINGSGRVHTKSIDVSVPAVEPSNTTTS
ncbi:MAG: hypothetical protein ACI8ZM_005190 [Crocinitomix sp.]|jgi:hypothetical protein